MIGRAGLNLTAALALAGFADLVLHRLAVRLFVPQQPTANAVWRAVAEGGLFAFHLAGVLGLVVAAASLYRAIRSGVLFPRSMRITVSTISLFFLVLAAGGVLLLPLPDRFVVHLKTAHAFLAWFILLALWRTGATPGAKLCVTLFCVPAILHAAALFMERMGASRPLSAELARVSELMALAAAALSPWLLAPRPPGAARRALGVGAGLFAGALVTLLAAVQFDLLQALALYGLRLDLPSLSTTGGWAALPLFVLGTAGLVTAAIWTLPDAGGTRLIGYGLLLVAAAGHQVLTPTHVLLATSGLVALALGATNVGPAVEPQPASADAPITAAPA